MYIVLIYLLETCFYTYEFIQIKSIFFVSDFLSVSFEGVSNYFYFEEKKIMRSLFSLSATPKATKVNTTKSPKKKAPPVRDYPTNSPYSTSRMRKGGDFDDVMSTASAKSNAKDKELSEASDIAEENKNNKEQKEQTQKVENTQQKTPKKPKRENLIDEYNELVRKYSEAIEEKQYLIEEKEITIDAINILYSNQIKLEKGVIPTSMQEELDNPPEEEEIVEVQNEENTQETAEQQNQNEEEENKEQPVEEN